MCSAIRPIIPIAWKLEKQFDALMVDDGERFFFQPCFSPVWDTAIAAFAVGESSEPPRRCLATLRGLAAHQGSPAQGRLVREASQHGTFRLVFRIRQRVLSGYRRHRHGLAGVEPLAGVQRTRRSKPVASAPCNGCCDMQSKDGGWAAFDVDNNWRFLSYVPFADHNAMLDPTCPDITGRVLEALCALRA